jgi:mannosyltransferase OCH1-like enzyme
MDINTLTEDHKRKIMSIREKKMASIRETNKETRYYDISLKNKIDEFKRKMNELKSSEIKEKNIENNEIKEFKEVELLGCLDKTLLESRLGIFDIINLNPSDVYISLATIPPRLTSDDFENVIQSLVNQTIKPKRVIVNICTTYKREFNIDNITIRGRINYLRSKFGSNIIFNVSPDYGPITKILGLLHLKDIKMNSDDIIIVLDDDWQMKSNLTFYYKYVYQLYQCDCVFIDEHQVMDQSNGKFIDNKTIFYDGYTGFVYGWLSFSLKYRYIEKLLKFYENTINLDDYAISHDDLLITLFYKDFKLNAAGINMYFNNSFIDQRMEIEEKNALRIEEDTFNKRINLEKKLLDMFGITYYCLSNGSVRLGDIQRSHYQVNSYIKRRDYLLNVKNVYYDPENNDFLNKQIDYKYLDKNILIVTVTIFNNNLIKNRINFKIQENNMYFTMQQFNSNRATFFLKIDESIQLLYKGHDHTKKFKVLQTAEENTVTPKAYNSILTVLSYLPDIEYRFFNDTERSEYIAKYYNKFLVHYNKLIPGAFRADLFRALYLYREGGLYLDCKNILYSEIDLLNYVPEIFVKDIGQGYICNGFMFIKNPGNNKIKKYIDEMVNNIGSNFYGENALHVTGPKVLGNHVNENIYLENKITDNNWKNSYLVYTQNKKILIKNSYHGYYDEGNYLDTGHYSKLWKERKVYAF